ncbi:MAG: hypothetical protein PHW04_07230 [Candidatus Wallbacteria bacterium]|nr:hypothetical protein [Candidatus Wallbacteria bacterium]
MDLRQTLLQTLLENIIQIVFIVALPFLCKKTYNLHKKKGKSKPEKRLFLILLITDCSLLMLIFYAMAGLILEKISPAPVKIEYTAEMLVFEGISVIDDEYYGIFTVNQPAGEVHLLLKKGETFRGFTLKDVDWVKACIAMKNGKEAVLEQKMLSRLFEKDKILESYRGKINLIYDGNLFDFFSSQFQLGVPVYLSPCLEKLHKKVMCYSISRLDAIYTMLEGLGLEFRIKNDQVLIYRENSNLIWKNSKYIPDPELVLDHEMEVIYLPDGSLKSIKTEMRKVNRIPVEISYQGLTEIDGKPRIMLMVAFNTDTAFILAAPGDTIETFKVISFSDQEIALKNLETNEEFSSPLHSGRSHEDQAPVNLLSGLTVGCSPDTTQTFLTYLGNTYVDVFAPYDVLNTPVQLEKGIYKFDRLIEEFCRKNGLKMRNEQDCVLIWKQ